MEYKQSLIKKRPYLPQLVYYFVAMMTAVTMIHGLVHITTLSVLFVMNKLMTQDKPSHLNDVSHNAHTKTFIWVIMLVFFYGIFLQMGDRIWFSFDVFGLTIKITETSFVYAVHYVTLFMIFIWISHLVWLSKKLDQLHVFFKGDLFPLTLIWNGTILEYKHLFKLKQNFEDVIVARGAKVSFLKKWPQFLFYTALHHVSHMQTYIFSFTRFKAPESFDAYIPWKRVIGLMIVFLVTSMAKSKLHPALYYLILGGVLMVLMMMFLYVFKNQSDSFYVKAYWKIKDVFAVLLLIVGWVYMSITNSSFYRPTFVSFFYISELSMYQISWVGIMHLLGLYAVVENLKK